MEAQINFETSGFNKKLRKKTNKFQKTQYVENCQRTNFWGEYLYQRGRMDQKRGKKLPNEE